MAKSGALELSIHIAGKVDKSLTTAINTTQSSISNLSRDLSRIGTAGLAAMGTLATGTVALLAKCTDKAQEFEQQMSDVVKYVIFKHLPTLCWGSFTTPNYLDKIKITSIFAYHFYQKPRSVYSVLDVL